MGLQANPDPPLDERRTRLTNPQRPAPNPKNHVSIRYTERLSIAGIEPSVGSVGDAYDNAVAETINGLYKTEVVRRRQSWRAIDEVEMETLKWVYWFNQRRLLEPVGNIAPVEAGEAFCANLNTLDMVA